MNPRIRRVLLLSCYELGHQPLGLAVPLAFLKRAGLEGRAIDLAVQPLDEDEVRRAQAVLVSVPMHTALRAGLGLASRIRALNPECLLAYHGLYATLNADLLLARGADAVLSGECEEALVRLVSNPGSFAPRPEPVRERLDFPVPLREGLPPLSSYARVEHADGTLAQVGSVETTRGCLHLCRHCPIPPIYLGRFFVVPVDAVLADVRQLVARGAGHVDFVDPDFLNGPGHALAVARALHAEFPEVTFNFTAKVEHLLKQRRLLPELRSLGGLFVVSAVESLSDRVLRELDKGHTREDVFRALEQARSAGMALRPTFVPFTPWSTAEDYREILGFIAGQGLVSSVDPVQLTIRLLIPPGSLLLQNESLRGRLGRLDPEALTYRWTHPDPGMDRLQRSAEALVAGAVESRLSVHEVFHSLVELAWGDSPQMPVASERARAPRLTEDWFC